MEKGPNISFDTFWDAYDKKVGKKSKLEKKWNKLTDRERSAILAHIPLYIAAQPNKQFRKNPETYLNNESWNDEIIDYSNGVQKATEARKDGLNDLRDLARSVMGQFESGKTG